MATITTKDGTEVVPSVQSALLTEIAAIDTVLLAHKRALGDDFTGYRNHTYRVANLCVAFAPGGAEQHEQIALAAAFHDLGIWTDGTFDYLEPSVRLARAYLDQQGRAEWAPEIATMIREHHGISSRRDDTHPLVEPFRRADWVDVSRGVVRFGLSGAYVEALYSTWPSAGFHKRLVQLSRRRLLTHPWSPLPMLRL